MFYKKIWAVLRKDFLEAKRNVLLLMLILLLPVAFGFVTGAFKERTPVYTPLLIVPQNENVTENDLLLVCQIANYSTTPEIEYNRTLAMNRLMREEAYFIVTIPDGVSNRGKTGEGNVIWVYVDSSITPVAEVSGYVVDAIDAWTKSYGYEGNVWLKRIGKRQNPFIYFIPGIFILLICIVGFLIIPMGVSKDRWVMERIMISTKTPLSLILFGRLLYAVFLVMVQFAVLNITEYALGAPTQLDPRVIAIIVLTTLALTSIGLFTVIITKFRDAGKHVNALLMGVVIIFSWIVYPVGFLPDMLRHMAELFPVYYSAVLMRCFMFKDMDYALVGDYVLIVVAFAVISILLMFLSTRRIRAA